MSNYTLGINASGYISSACILKDGKILAAAAEERFTRIKRDQSFPHEAIKYCLKKNFDTVFSSIDYKPFLWRRNKHSIYPVTGNPFKRKRRQIMNDINETGSYYITNKATFKKFKNRFGKKVSNYDSDILSLFEIDTLNDYKFIKELFKTSILKNHKISLPKKIK